MNDPSPQTRRKRLLKEADGLGKMMVVVAQVLLLLTLMLMVTSTTAFINQPVSYSITTRIRPSSSSSSFTPLYVGGSDEDENNINKDSLLTLQEEGKNSNDDDDGNNTNETSSSTTAAASLKSDAQFGEVSRLHGDDDPTATARFGDVVRFDDGNNRNNNNRPATSSNETTSAESNDSSSSSSSLTKQVETRKRNNIVVALLSIGLAFVNYFWQWTHPISAIQLLATMEQSSAPITVIAGKSSNSGNTAATTTTGNGKPTMVEFWAPWCENCKQMAPTLYQIEQEYSDSVNFILVNGDSPESWPLIELFGVDAIPHIAMVEADGTVDTALIGPVPKAWLEQDLQVLVENSKLMDDDSVSTERAKLPYKMLDTFSNRPEERKIQSNMLSSKQ
eukprot:scaffold22558_cov116-Cylindrotheca_fusiformis.AAC.5